MSAAILLASLVNRGLVQNPACSWGGHGEVTVGFAHDIRPSPPAGRLRHFVPMHRDARITIREKCPFSPPGGP